MSKKYWLTAGGLTLAAINYAFVKALSYEPKITRYHLKDNAWRGEKPLKLALVSDFHGGSGMWSGKALARIVKQEAPDAVLVSGDHFDHRYDANVSFDFFKHIAASVPTFFVTGNNEEILEARDSLMFEMASHGVHPLDNTAHTLSLHGQDVTILGFPDVAHFQDKDEWIWAAQQSLKETATEEDDGAYHIVLSHRPERNDFYRQLRCHLVLTGHAHGAQWQLPILGGVFAPHQHLFPRYYHGAYKIGKRHPFYMVVGAGFDVHPVVPRIFNRPELVIVEITQP